MYDFSGDRAVHGTNAQYRGENTPRRYDGTTTEQNRSRVRSPPIDNDRDPYSVVVLMVDTYHKIGYKFLPKRIYSALNYKGTKVITQRIKKIEYIRDRERDELGAYERETPKQVLA